ncbi:hypothetical protein F4V89_29265 [Neorhizobium galegae]|nr:hypothetical protein F4V89_29265 [Neorhizobium galegae]
MSFETHSPSVAGFRCEAVTSNTIESPCLHSRLANILHAQSADADLGENHPDDPAVLIGLAFAFVRRGRLLNGHVPEPLIVRLSALAEDGNAGCRLMLDWLRNRNRDLRRSGNKHPTPSTIALQTAPQRPRGSPRERVLAPIAKPDRIDGQRRTRTRPRDPVQNPKTAIIAAETGGRIDG